MEKRLTSSLAAIGLLVSIYGVVVTIQDKNRSREIECTVNTSCIDAKSVFPAPDTTIRIWRDQQVLDNLCVTTLTFESTGLVEIKPEEFNEIPIQVNFSAEGFLLDATIANSVPDNLNVRIDHDSSQVRIHPTLLNQGDCFAIHVISSGKEPSITIKSRITGVSKIPVVKTFTPFRAVDISRWLLAFQTFALAAFVFSITAKGVYVGHPIKNEAVLLPNRRYTRFFLGLLWASVGATFSLPFLSNTSWFLPAMCAGGLGIVTAQFTVMFRGSRWTAYKEVSGDERLRIGGGML
ncbi:MAG: hypothetical protein IT225_08010 [Flavobacteriales bacterium]|nr:hypothetical protein [Flavobacteriales bacterium]